MKTRTTWCAWQFLAETDGDGQLLEELYKTIGDRADFIYETGEILNLHLFLIDNL